MLFYSWGARGLPGVENVPASQVLALTLWEASAREPRHLLLDRALSGPEGPRCLSARHGEGRNERDQPIGRCGRARVPAPVRPRRRKAQAHAEGLSS